MRKLLALISLGLLGVLAVTGSGSAHPSARTHFVITSGTVTVVLAGDLLDTLAADNATLTASGGAVITVNKAKQSILTLPVVGGLQHNAVIELASHCRCVGFRTRGTLTLTGNGKTMTLTKPDVQISSLLHQAQISVTARGAEESTVAFPPINLPRSLPGTTFSLAGLVGTVSPAGSGVFSGYAQHPGDPGDGAAPHFPTDRVVTFGTVSIKLRLQPLS